jgi:dTMP kinase
VFNADKGVDLDIATLKADYNRMLAEAEAKRRAAEALAAEKKAAKQQAAADRKAAEEQRREEERIKREAAAAAGAESAAAAEQEAAAAAAKAAKAAEVQKKGLGGGRHLAVLASECDDPLSAEDCIAYVRQPMGPYNWVLLHADKVSGLLIDKVSRLKVQLVYYW